MIRRILDWLRQREATVISSPLLSVVPAPPWSPEDARQLLTFLRSPTGQTMLMKARAMEASTCVAACAGKGNPSRAAGISDTLNWLESLATISGADPVQTANDETSHAQNENLDPELSYS